MGGAALGGGGMCVLSPEFSRKTVCGERQRHTHRRPGPDPGTGDNDGKQYAPHLKDAWRK